MQRLTPETPLDRDAALRAFESTWREFVAFIEPRSDAEAAPILAHVARWHENCIACLGELMAGQEVTKLDVDAVNARWAETDRELDRAAANRRCVASQARLWAAVVAVPSERWNQEFVRALHWDTWNHYADHIEWLSRG